MRRLPIAAVLLSVAALATAQDDRAFERYREGVSALERGDRDAALEAFRAALLVEGRPEYALALAATLQEGGELHEAVELYEALLEEEFGPLDGREAAIREARDTAKAALATLRVRSEADGPLEVTLDDEPVGTLDGSEPLTLRVDPGEHRVRGRTSAGGMTETLLFRLEASEEREVALRVLDAEPSPTPADPPIAEAPDAPDRPSATGGWILLGAAAVPLGIAVVAGVLHGQRVDDARGAVSQVAAEPFIADARRLGRMANVSLAIALATGIAGVAWVVIQRLRGRGSETTLAGPLELGLRF